MPKSWIFNMGRTSKINQQIADDIRLLKKTGWTYAQIRVKYPQISAQQMSRIVTNQAWVKSLVD